MKRRDVLSVAVAVSVSGCVFGSEDADEAAPGTEQTPESPTRTPERSAESYLPPSGDGWTRTDVYQPGLGETGLTDAAVGKYRSPDGVRYDVVVIFSGTAERLLDANWQIAVPIENGAMAASTGQQGAEPTPEHPPQPSMEGTPVPGTDEEALELLARSPELTEAEVEANCMPC